MQDSLKIEYTPTHHRREHNVSETTQASFPAKFKAICIKLGQERHHQSVPKILCALGYIIKYRQQIKTATQ